MKGFSTLAAVSAAAGAILLVMVSIGVWTGVSQQHFEWFAPPDAYAGALRAGAGPLRVIIGLDNVFIATYAALIILMSRTLLKEENKLLLGVFLIAGVIAGALDYLENHHILTMLSAAESGLIPTVGELQERMIASMFKWHLGYFAFFLLALAFPAKRPAERIFRFSLLFWQLPVGVFYYVAPESLFKTFLFYARYGNLVFGFFLIAWFFAGRRSSPENGARRLAGHAAAA